MEQVLNSIVVQIKEWDRKRPPVLLMGKLFTETNRQNCIDYCRDLSDAVVKKDYVNLKSTGEILQRVKSEYHNVHYSKTIADLTKIIKHAPRSSAVLRDALSMRADVLATNGYLEQAIIDNELQLKEIYQSDHQQLDKLTGLIECYVELGYNKKAEDYLVEFKRAYDLQFGMKVEKLNGAKVRKQAKYAGLKENYLQFYERIKNRLESTAYKSMRKEGDVTINCKPCNGYNENPKIKNLSASCNLIIQNKRHRIIANCVIGKSEIVGVESPYLRQQIGEPSHCDHCYSAKKLFLPCFECHFKNYCSYECKAKDHKWHQFECIAYKLLIIPTLRCDMLFRIFIQYLFSFKIEVFQRNYIRNLRTAEDLFKNLWEILPTVPPNILTEDSFAYEKFPDVEYKKIVLNSFRLSIFICEHTHILNEFFSSLALNREELEIFIATFLLTLSAKITTISLLINDESNNMNVPFETNKDVDEMRTKQKVLRRNFNFSENTFTYFGLDKNKMKIAAISKVETAFVNYCMENTDLNIPLVNEDDYYEPFQNTNDIVENWMNVNPKEENYCESNTIGLYSILLKFSHSCDPNLRLIYLQPGTLLLKACREIQPGDILTISYGCYYKKSENNLRVACNKKFNIECLCEYCNGRFYTHFPENVMCRNCKYLISRTELLCEICGKSTIKAINVYNQLIWEMEYNMLETGEDRVTFYNLVFTLMVYEEIMPSTNHIFMAKLLCLANFLAQRNFIYEAYVFLSRSQTILQKIYVEMSIDLLYAYNMILNPAMDVLMNNVDNIIATPGSVIDKFFDLSLKVVNEMLDINDFNELYDEFTCDILNKYQQILKLKNKIYSSIVDSNAFKRIVKAFQKKNNHICRSRIFTNSAKEFDIFKSDEIYVKVFSSNNDNSATKNMLETIPEEVKQIEELYPFDGNLDKNDDLNVTECLQNAKKSQDQLFYDECVSFFKDLMEKRVDFSQFYIV